MPRSGASATSPTQSGAGVRMRRWSDPFEREEGPRQTLRMYLIATWLVGGGLSAVILGKDWFPDDLVGLHTLPPWDWVYVVAYVATQLAAQLAVKPLTARRKNAARLIVRGLLLRDMAWSVVVVHYTGGINSLMLMVFPILLLVSASDQSRRFTLLLAGGLVAGLGGVLVAEAVGWAPHHPMYARLDTAYTSPTLVTFRLTVFTVVCLLMILWGERVANRMRQAYRSLEHNYASLQEAVKELRRMDTMKDDFVSNVSHELRTPLTSIIGYTDYLRQRADALGPEKTREYYDTIIREGERLQRLINEVLDLQKMLRGQMTFNMARTDIGRLFHSVIKALSPLVSQNKLRIISSIQNNLPELHVDEDRIGQVFTNLLSNAIKFSPERGKIRVIVRYLDPSAPDVDIPAAGHSGPAIWRLEGGEGEDDGIPGIDAGAGAVLISVADEGRGIPADMLTAIFEKFQQVYTADMGKDKGTGLGLPIAKEIVEYHGGRLWVDSTLGQGSTFYVWLPVTRPPADIQEEPRGENLNL